MLWYPLLAHRQKEIESMLKTIRNNVKEINANTALDTIELLVNSPDAHKETSLQDYLKAGDKKNPPRLYGSGMLVINTPWNLIQEAEETIAFLTSIFYS